MIKVSIMYPNGPETSFDVDYYKKLHPPMIAESFRGRFKGEFNVGIEEGSWRTGALWR
jgi:hypothetical protein